MAKKKTAAKAGPKKAAAPKARQRSPGERVPLMVRLSKEVHAKIAKAAERGGISVNMLVESLLTGCAEHLIEGRPIWTDKGALEVRHDPGAYFVGYRGITYVLVDAERDGPGPHDWRFDGEQLNGLGPYQAATPYDEDAGKPKVKGIVLFTVDHSRSPVKSWVEGQ